MYVNCFHLMNLIDILQIWGLTTRLRLIRPVYAHHFFNEVHGPSQVSKKSCLRLHFSFYRRSPEWYNLNAYGRTCRKSITSFISEFGTYLDHISEMLVIHTKIPLTGLNPPQFCACPKLGPGFPTSYAVVFLVFR